MTRSTLITRISLVTAATLAAATASAVPSAPGKFSDFYAAKGIDASALSNQSCRLCHGGIFPNGGNLNDFGSDVQAKLDIRASTVDFSAIEALDSDRDGASNLDEIKAGTLPSDSSSKP
jgi:hypothetical protein